MVVYIHLVLLESCCPSSFDALSVYRVNTSGFRLGAGEVSPQEGILLKTLPIIICCWESKNRALPVKSSSCWVRPYVGSVATTDFLAVLQFGSVASKWTGLCIHHQ